MLGLYQIAVILHVLAAIVWVGGILFIASTALPVAKTFEGSAKARFTRRLGRRFRKIGWIALATLVVTGVIMIGSWGATPDSILSGDFFTSTRHRVLGYKLLCVAMMLCITGLHDWYIGPLASRDQLTDKKKAQYRTWASWLGRVTGGFAVVITVLAIYIARPWLLN